MRHLHVSAALVTLLFAGTAVASPPLVPVTIRGKEDPLVVELYAPDAKPRKDEPIARCTSPCSAEVPAGRYKLYIHGGDGTVSSRRLVDVSGPSAFTVSPKSTAQRAGGLALGIAGSALVFAGFVVTLTGLCAMSHSSDTGSCNADDRQSTGFALMFGGAILAPIGWIVFANSYRADVQQTPLRYGLAPAVFPGGNRASDPIPGVVFTGRF